MVKVDMEKISKHCNTQYREGAKWCGFCGTARTPDERNRCTTCNRLLRNRMRFSKYREDTMKRIK